MIQRRRESGWLKLIGGDVDVSPEHALSPTPGELGLSKRHPLTMTKAGSLGLVDVLSEPATSAIDDFLLRTAIRRWRLRSSYSRAWRDAVVRRVREGRASSSIQSAFTHWRRSAISRRHVALAAGIAQARLGHSLLTEALAHWRESAGERHRLAACEELADVRHRTRQALSAVVSLRTWARMQSVTRQALDILFHQHRLPTALLRWRSVTSDAVRIDGTASQVAMGVLLRSARSTLAAWRKRAARGRAIKSVVIRRQGVIKAAAFRSWLGSSRISKDSTQSAAAALLRIDTRLSTDAARRFLILWRRNTALAVLTKRTGALHQRAKVRQALASWGDAASQQRSLEFRLAAVSNRLKAARTLTAWRGYALGARSLRQSSDAVFAFTATRVARSSLRAWLKTTSVRQDFAARVQRCADATLLRRSVSSISHWRRVSAASHERAAIASVVTALGSRSSARRCISVWLHTTKKSRVLQAHAATIRRRAEIALLRLAVSTWRQRLTRGRALCDRADDIRQKSLERRASEALISWRRVVKLSTKAGEISRGISTVLIRTNAVLSLSSWRQAVAQLQQQRAASRALLHAVRRAGIRSAVSAWRHAGDVHRKGAALRRAAGPLADRLGAHRALTDWRRIAAVAAVSRAHERIALAFRRHEDVTAALQHWHVLTALAVRGAAVARRHVALCAQQALRAWEEAASRAALNRQVTASLVAASRKVLREASRSHALASWRAAVRERRKRAAGCDRGRARGAAATTPGDELIAPASSYA